MRIIANPLLTEPCEDFSRSRSPSRALRRYRQKGIRGHGQFQRPSRKVFVTGDTIICHPAMRRDIEAMLAKREPR